MDIFILQNFTFANARCRRPDRYTMPHSVNYFYAPTPVKLMIVPIFAAACLHAMAIASSSLADASTRPSEVSLIPQKARKSSPLADRLDLVKIEITATSFAASFPAAAAGARFSPPI